MIRMAGLRYGIVLICLAIIGAPLWRPYISVSTSLTIIDLSG